MKYCILFCWLLIGIFTAVQAQVPTNDACAGAIVLPCNGTHSGNTTNATNDVIPAFSCGSSVSGTYKGVWYKMTAVNDQGITVSTCNGAGWDTYLRVYAGTCGSLTSCLGYSDDFCSTQSSVTFNTVTGVTYYILLAGYSTSAYGSYTISATCVNCPAPINVYLNSYTQTTAEFSWQGTGSTILEYGAPGFTPGNGASAGVGGTIRNPPASPYSLTGLSPGTYYDVYLRKNCTATGFGFSPNSPVLNFLTERPPAPNDNCSTAIEVGSTPLFSNCFNATQSLVPGTCGDNTSSTADDVWYYFTATASGQAEIQINNPSPDFDGIIEAYSGTCSGTLTSIGCANTIGNGIPEILSLGGLNPGTKYYFRVYGWNGSLGEYNLTVCPGQLVILPNAGSFCNTDSITITGSILNNPYQWYRDGILIPGATSNQLKTGQAGVYKALAQLGTCTLNSNQIELLPAPEAALIGGTGVYAEGYFPVNIGITNYVDEQSYLWKKGGITVYGPPYGGNGGNQSFQFTMSGPPDAGDYIVEAERSGCPPLNSNTITVYYGGVKNLAIDSARHDKVGFSWQNFNNPVQYFEYFVSESPDPFLAGNSSFTAANFAVVNGLTPSTQYYLHIQGGSVGYIPSNPQPFDFTFVGQWTTIPFSTTALPTINDCSNAVWINHVPLAASNTSATQSIPPATCSGYTATLAIDVWFKFTALGTTANIVVDATDGGFDAVVQAFSGSCTGLNALACIDATVSGQSENLSLTNLTPGNTYLVRVYGWEGGTGTFQVSVCQPLAITSTATNFCNTSSITLSTNYSNTNVSWLRNGITIPGANQSQIEVTSDGNYQAVLTSGSCNSSSNIIPIITNSVVSPQLNSGAGVYAASVLVDIEVASTVSGQTYLLRKSGVSESPTTPMNGNGGNQSFILSMAQPTSGTYYVETFKTNGCTDYSSNFEIEYGGVNNLQVDNCPFNTVQFSWTNYNNSVQRFRYIINEQLSPVGEQDTTGLNQVTVSNLLPGHQYYIHVSGSTIPDFNLNNIVYSDNWVTIPFTTTSVPVSSTSCEWSGAVDTNWNNVANWRCGFKPQTNSDVLVPVGVPRYPVVSANTTIKSLIIKTGASITVSPGINLNISN